MPIAHRERKTITGSVRGNFHPHRAARQPRRSAYRGHNAYHLSDPNVAEHVHDGATTTLTAKTGDPAIQRLSASVYCCTVALEGGLRNRARIYTSSLSRRSRSRPGPRFGLLLCAARNSDHFPEVRHSSTTRAALRYRDPSAGGVSARAGVTAGGATFLGNQGSTMTNRKRKVFDGVSTRSAARTKARSPSLFGKGGPRDALAYCNILFPVDLFSVHGRSPRPTRKRAKIDKPARARPKRTGNRTQRSFCPPAYQLRVLPTAPVRSCTRIRKTGIQGRRPAPPPPPRRHTQSHGSPVGPAARDRDRFPADVQRRAGGP